MTRVLVVDDSSFMRKALTRVVESDSAMEVVGTAAGVNVHKVMPLLKAPYEHGPHARVTPREVVVVGASTGGPRAVMKTLSGLPADTPATIIVALHMDPEFLPSFARAGDGGPARSLARRDGRQSETGPGARRPRRAADDVHRGLRRDGAKGMKAIKDAGGGTIAEDESTSVSFGMPRAAIELGCVDRVVPLNLVAQAILEMV